MTETTARFRLPLLAAGQAQKEIWHNEALAHADLALYAAAEAIADDPPETPTPGQCWIVGEAPTGDWTDRSGWLAGWTSGGWRFIEAVPGMSVWLVAEAVWAVRVSDTWTIGRMPVRSIVVDGLQVIGPRQPSIAEPTGGATVDPEARGAIGSLIAALRSHGLIEG